MAAGHRKKNESRNTPRAFADALRRIAVKKPFVDITVREVVREAGISSRTFYNHFRSKYDLVLWSYANADYSYLKTFESKGEVLSFEELLLLGLRRFSKDRPLFKGAFSDWAGPESLCMALVEHGTHAIPEYIRIIHGDKAATDQVVSLVRFYVEGAVSEIARWMMDVNPMPDREFRDYLVDAMPSSIHKLLTSPTTTRKDKRK